MVVYLKKNKPVSAASFADASAAVRKAWHGKSGSAFYRDPAAGLIHDDNGTAVAHVSFNGRGWSGTARLTLDLTREINIGAAR